MKNKMQEKHYFYDDVDDFLNSSRRNAFLLMGTILIIIFLLFLVFCAILSGNVEKKIPEYKKIFETNYDTIYEPKYAILEKVVNKAIMDNDINDLIFIDTNHQISLDDNSYVINVELNGDESGYPYKITTRLSPEKEILSQKSDKLSKYDYVEAHINVIKTNHYCDAFLISMGCLILLLLVFSCATGISWLHKKKANN